MLNLKVETAKRLTSLGISENTTFALFEQGLFDERTAKKFLVREEYRQANPHNGQKGDLKEELADKFCVSSAMINIYLKL
jgi:hypothetical protein